MTNNNWDESKHPRDNDGKFTYKGLGETSTESDEEKMQNRADNLYGSDEEYYRKYPKQKAYKANGTLTGGAASIKQTVEDEIAGVKKGEPMSFEEAMIGVNPNYDKNEQYKRNCAASAAVFIARMKGYDIEALPYKNNKEYVSFTAAPYLAFIDPKTGTKPNFTYTNTKSYKELNNWMHNNIKEGGMYMFSYKPNPESKNYHTILTFKNPKGVVIYYDPQNSNFYNEKIPPEIAFYSIEKTHNVWEYSDPKVLRVDDKDLDTAYFGRFSKKTK